MDRLSEMITELMKETKEIKCNQRIYQEEMIKIKQENEQLRAENKEIRKELNQIKYGMEILEKDRVRSNIVISGVSVNKESGESLRRVIEDFCKQDIEVEVTVKDAIKIGQTVCKIELASYSDKEKIMINKKKLKFNKAKIFINKERTRYKREIQRKIKIYAEEEQKKGSNVKIRERKLIIEEEEWIWNKNKDEMEKKPINVKNDDKRKMEIKDKVECTQSKN